MNPTQILAWKGWRYSVKPFTPRTYFSLSEAIYAESEKGAYLSGTKRVAIETLLVPLDPESAQALRTGTLVNALYDAGEADVEEAFALLETISFLSNSYTERGNRLLKAQKDLGPDMLRKPEPSNSESQTATETEHGSSGPVAET